ncbi:ribosome silencing factor [bacterium]|nr:ribosome silencing factor [bacterium]
MTQPKQDARRVVDLTVEALRSRKGEDILVMDLRGVTDLVDYFVLCTGNSDTQVKALADAVVEALERDGTGPWHVEGYEGRKWVLVDAVDVAVHVFQGPVREFYRLERLWGDARMEMIPDEAETVESGQASQMVSEVP